MKTRLAVAAALMALTCPSSASAGVPVAWQQKALATAQRVWHPTCGTFRIQWSDRDAAGIDGHTVGWAFAGDCSLYLPREKVWLGYPELCEVVLHEGGHATGLGHSDHGIMRPVSYITFEWAITQSGRRLERWDGIDRRCLTSNSGASRTTARRCHRSPHRPVCLASSAVGDRVTP